MSIYHDIISGATGITDKSSLREIEEIMRHDIFHSTLDWQTREQLESAAKEAHEVLKYLRAA